MTDFIQNFTSNKKYQILLRVLIVIALLFIFLIGIKTLSGGFKLLGSGFAKSLFDISTNPFLSLMTGMLATVLFQSSSVTTAMIVGLVSSTTLSIGGAVPMIMGANLGTSVTNTLVSLGYINNTKNFKRAFAAATVHDFFNIMSVMILLPLEIATGFIESIATKLSAFMYGSIAGLKYKSPIKAAIKPASKWIKSTSIELFGQDYAGVAMIVVAGIIIIAALSMIVRTMKQVVQEEEESLINSFLSKNGYATILFGALVTISVQSSSITTSLLIPMAGSGLLTLETIYPVTLGANIGTTATALLAALTGNMAGLSIALVHLIFNLLGVTLFYPVKSLRRLPIICAEKLAESIEKSRFIGLGYVGGVFFALPISLIYIAS